jgi:hypothetical protein
MGIKDLIAKCTERNLTKVSSPTPNVANLIAAHIRHIAPELAAVPGLWFSGSNVWRWLYNDGDPAPDADIDCFFTKPVNRASDGGFGSWTDQRSELVRTLGIPPSDQEWSTVRTGFQQDKYAMGVKFLFKGRKVDLWEGLETAALTLADYPTASHAHCRAAFSFTEGLVVLPNEAA